MLGIINMDTVFQRGDRVYCIIFGWGTVVKLDNSKYPIGVEFDSKIINSYSSNGSASTIGKPILSFTEYTLEGFTQERSEVLPNKGDIVWGKGNYTTDWSIGHYLGKENVSHKISSTPNAASYWLANKITTKNPYTNEGSI